jgi:hypothetical protein
MVVVLWFLMMLEAPPKLKQGCRSEIQGQEVAEAWAQAHQAVVSVYD